MRQNTIIVVDDVHLASCLHLSNRLSQSNSLIGRAGRISLAALLAKPNSYWPVNISLPTQGRVFRPTKTTVLS